MSKIIFSGRVFDSKTALARYLGINESSVRGQIKRKGYFERDGKKAVEIDDSEIPSFLEPHTEDGIVSELHQKFTDDELKLIAKGFSPKQEMINFPKPNFTGKHYKVGVMSDLHLGSKYSSPEYIKDALKEMETVGCDFITLGGDLVDGMTSKRPWQIYELSVLGYSSQRDLAVEVLGSTEVPIMAISGNHDLYFQQSAGANIVKDICDRIPNMTFLGDHEGDINVSGATIKLWHGIDGNSYATSYRLQKIIESFSNNEYPDILLASHTHKFCYLFDRDIHAISTACMQKQTKFMRGKKLAAHVGFCILEFDVLDSQVTNLSCRYYPYYN